MSRKLFYIPAFLVVLLGIVPLFIDFSDYAVSYIADAQKTIGRTIKVGTIRLQILPTPRIKINDVLLGNAQGAKNPEMVKVKSVEVILSLFDLLKGNVVVKNVEVNTPEITLEKFSSGNANWEIFLSQSQEKETKQTTSSQPVNAAAAGLVVKHFNISNATVHYIDHQENTKKSFSNLNVECSSEELLGPYKIHVRADHDENRIDIAMLTGILNFNEKTSLEADISLSAQNQKVQLKMSGAVDISKQLFEGKFKASAVDFPFVLELPNQKIDLKKSTDVQGEIQATKEEVAIKNLSINHPIGQIIGALKYNLSQQFFQASLKFKHQKDSINFELSTKNFTEFDYHVSSAHYKEILEWFTQGQVLKAEIDVKGVFKLENDILTFKKTILQLGDATAESNVQFNITTKQTTADVKMQSIQHWGSLFGHNLPFSGPVALTVQLTPGKECLAVSSKISISKGNIQFNGNLGENSTLAKGSLTLEQVHLNDYIVNLKSNISVKPTEIDLAIQSIGLKDKSELDLSAGGKLLIDLSKGKPHIVGSITAQPMQLTSYQNTPVHLVRALYIPENTGYHFMQVAANTNSRWSSDLIKLPLNAFTMSLQINIPKLTLSGLVFESLQSEIVLNTGKLAVPFSARMYGGKLNGALLVETAKQQSINLSAKFDEISIEKIQAAAAHFSRGKASGQIELKTQGDSQYDWVSRLQGHAQFKIIDGVVKGFDLHEIVNLLKKPKNLLDLKNLQSSFSGKGETAFSNASGKFNIAKGVASTNDLTIDATDAQLKAEGQADILNWQMQFVGSVSSPTLKNIPPLKFTIKGPLDQPSYNLDLKQIQQLFMQSGASDLLSKIPGIGKFMPGSNKKAKEAAPQASNSNAAKAEGTESLRPEKVVKGLLKGIFG